MRKIILFGTGKHGLKALEKLRQDREVEEIVFCDNDYFPDKQLDGIPIIDFNTLTKIYKEYEVIVTPVNLAAIAEISVMLERKNIPYKLWIDPKVWLLHVYGKYPDMHYEIGKNLNYHCPWDCTREIDLYKQVINTYPDVFASKQVDFYHYFDDKADYAYILKKILKLPCVFGYGSVYARKNDVIPIPDYTLITGCGGLSYEEMVVSCRANAKKRWEDDRAFWAGTLSNNPTRPWLERMGELYPEKLEIRGWYKGEKERQTQMTVLPQEQWKYKYIIDIAGVAGWTDRLSQIMQLGRVVLYVDRTEHNWFYQYMKPWEHYVPIKADLSDLIEKIDYMNEHMELYQKIVESSLKFAQEHLTKEKMLEYMKDMIVKYGIKRENS